MTRPPVADSPTAEWAAIQRREAERATPLRRIDPRVYTTLAITGGWCALLLAPQNLPLAMGFGVLATLLGTYAAILGRQVARQRAEFLRRALDAAQGRTTELERLRYLATVLLGGESSQQLQDEIARAAAELLEAEAAMVCLVAEEGRFLRIAAGVGPLVPHVGLLLPVERSLVGWVMTHDEPVLCPDAASDPRNFDPAGPRVALTSTAIMPLRSHGVVIGTVSAYNRRDGRQFDAHDLQLLAALGELVVLGLDRQAMLEDARQSEQQLAVKNRELVRATQLKSQFLTNMSHELRTPLNAIIGFSDLLLTRGVGDLNEMQDDFLQSVLRNGRHLLGLINNILDLSKIEAGRMTLALGACDVRDILTGAVTDTASLRSAKRQECEVRCEPGNDLAITADGVRIRQILYNLLANASKFTDEGGQIAVTAVRTRAPLPIPMDRAGDGLPEERRFVARDAVWIVVQDTGVGIKAEDMPKLFREFGQVDPGLGRQHQGTGLGLALCKSFVEMHGGMIGAESLPDVGSAFWFMLPVEGPVRRAGFAAAAGVGAPVTAVSA